MRLPGGIEALLDRLQQGLLLRLLPRMLGGLAAQLLLPLPAGLLPLLEISKCLASFLLDELVGGFFAQAFLDAAGGDGLEPLEEVFFEGGLSQQGLHALGAACGGEEVGVSLEKVDGIELSLVG